MATINYACACGKQLKFKAEHSGKRTKCPDCNATITVPDAIDDVEEYEGGEADSPSGRVTRVTGKRAVVQWGQIVPSTYGSTTLEIDGGRLVETTQSPLTSRNLEILLSEVDSAEVRSGPNPVMLALGFGTLAFFGLGLVFLIAYFFTKRRYFVVNSGSNAMVVVITGHEERFHDFLDAVLAAAEREKRRS